MARRSKSLFNDIVGGVLLLVLLLITIIIEWVIENPWWTVGITVLALVIYACISIYTESREQWRAEEAARKRHMEQKHREAVRIEQEHKKARAKALNQTSEIHKKAVRSLRDTNAVAKLEAFQQQTEALILEEQLDAKNALIQKLEVKYAELSNGNNLLPTVLPERRGDHPTYGPMSNITNHDSDWHAHRSCAKKQEPPIDSSKIRLTVAKQNLSSCPVGHERAEHLAKGNILERYDFLRLKALMRSCSHKGEKSCSTSCKRPTPKYAG